MGKLSTHVLDTAHGKPAAGLHLRLLRGQELIKEATTNADGRTDALLLTNEDMRAGKYVIEFEVGDYFRSKGHPDAGKFLETVRVDFVIASVSEGYHVPLLVSPWSYSTYRGS
jgi:5-hydroxyisourate hydrolase